MFIHLFMCLFIYLCIYSFICLSVYVFIYMFICLFVDLFVDLFVYVFICLFIYVFILCRYTYIHIYRTIYMYMYSIYSYTLTYRYRTILLYKIYIAYTPLIYVVLTPAILGIQTQLWWRPHLPGFFRCNEKLSTGSVETVTLDIPKKKGHHWHHIHVIWNCIEYHRMTSSRLIPTSTNDQIWKIMENPWIGWESWGNQQGFPMSIFTNRPPWPSRAWSVRSGSCPEAARERPRFFGIPWLSQDPWDLWMIYGSSSVHHSKSHEISDIQQIDVPVCSCEYGIYWFRF